MYFTQTHSRTHRNIHLPGLSVFVVVQTQAAAARPQVWNCLLPNLRLCRLSYGQFRWLLKTFYSDSEATAQCELFLIARNRNILTYLLTSKVFKKAS